MLSVLQPPNSGAGSTIAVHDYNTAVRTEIAEVIINKRDKRLVNLTDVQAHLDLLAVFHKLHHAIQAEGVVVDPSNNVPIISAAQSLFLARAQYRFDLWVEKILQRPSRKSKSSLTSDEIPPVDVLMFLHTYMLNPWNYREDLTRVYPCLIGIGAFPWKIVHSLIDTETFELTSTPGQVRLWENFTSQPFEIPLITLPTELVSLSCPRCLSENAFPWINANGTGFGQGFSDTCIECALTIDCNALSVSKLLRDLASPEPLAHTLLDDRGLEDIESAHNISQAIKNKLDNPMATGGDPFGWNMSNVKRVLLEDIVDTKDVHHKLIHILRAYEHPGKSSLDLKSAVLRQGRFISTLHQIQWAGKNSAFVGKNHALSEAITRYERYFALARSHLGLVPTLDVDLIFHTHQLSGPNYVDDCLNVLGRVLNHDDSGESGDIRASLQHTIEAWNLTYQMPYFASLPPLYQPVTNDISLLGSVIMPCSNCNPERKCQHCGVTGGHADNCPHGTKK